MDLDGNSVSLNSNVSKIYCCYCVCLLVYTFRLVLLLGHIERDHTRYSLSLGHKFAI